MASTRQPGSSFELESQDTLAASDSSADPSQLSQTSSNTGSQNVRGVEQQLERADGGLAAWTILCAAWMFEAVLFGGQYSSLSSFAVSFGVFQSYYTKLPEFQNNSYISIIGTMASGIPYLGGAVVAIFVRRYLPYRIYMIWTGWLLCIVALIAGSFANSIGPLIITQGVMYGVGFVTFYYTILSLVSEWWITRRGMAFGIISSSAGASGIVMPFIIETLLNRYGYKTTLRAIAVTMTILTGPLVPLMRSRLPPQVSIATKQDWSFVRKPLFFVYCMANIAQGLGFFSPSLFLPSYAISIGLTARQGATLLSVMSAAQMLGLATFGILSDKVRLNLLVLLSTLVAGAASFTSWGLAHGLAPLIVFSLLFGFFGHGFSSFLARMGTAVSEEPTAALATFGTFNFCRGLGIVLAGPISSGLLSGGVKQDSYGITRYRAMVIFTGTCMLASALSVGSWYVRPRRTRAG